MSKGYQTEEEVLQEIKEKNYTHKQCEYFIDKKWIAKLPKEQQSKMKKEMGKCAYWNKIVPPDGLACFCFIKCSWKKNGK